MPKIIAISNPKGGVGKTTTVINLAASLAIAEQNVLIIDMDPDGAVSTGLGLQPENTRAGVFELFSGNADLMETIHPLNYLPMAAVPVNVVTSEHEIRLNEMAKNRLRIKQQISAALLSNKLNYDYILIDTPPALNDLTIGALLASDSILIPLQCGHFAIKAVERLMYMVERIRKSANPNLAIEGIMLNFYEKGTRASRRSLERAQSCFPGMVLKTRIPKNAAIGHSAFEQKPIALVDITAASAGAYLTLAEEILHQNCTPVDKSPLEKHVADLEPLIPVR